MPGVGETPGGLEGRRLRSLPLLEVGMVTYPPLTRRALRMLKQACKTVLPDEKMQLVGGSLKRGCGGRDVQMMLIRMQLPNPP